MDVQSNSVNSAQIVRLCPRYSHMHTPQTIDAPYPFRKLANSFFPSLVKIDSGWNCTPQIG